MNQFTKALLLSAMVSMANADDDDIFGHFSAPLEEDVPIVSIPCFANADGFGGSITDTSFTVEYYYEMVYRDGGDSVDELINSFETDSTNFILQSDLFDSPCNEVIARQAGAAHGISSNPPDDDLDGIPCTTIAGDPGQATSCAVVSGAFEVYYIDDGSGGDALKQQFKEGIENGINNGGVAISHPDIVEVAAVPDPTVTGRGEDPASTPTDIVANPDDDGNSTPVIIGAVVGGALIVGAIALYRSKQAGAAASGAAGAASSGASAGADV
mmetsp:Transcript_11558/g.27810  ORF Transcript_11558/g.27810 Transcript_11558/m.27810 type:complete len:270 (+) Transcript_11558:41-850(+)|eukprot:CAMPEP_0113623544 /NCGR_PEP_ID=MMETSP0017_2-20120614/12115_1 /TAXON_ID=2856 /ORGANISM="Cylindrotheca closterium" /LENGTH=269 /DNA_ID=CAMNT_0000533503 /DNA_START=48 /DNA_END=857 /DNA_ORIENTATION=+ /assembly_acc=CAM_ASM_000147